VILGGLLTATLVRLSPGFGVDERELDPRLSPESIAAIRAQNAAHRNILRFYAQYLEGFARGDLGNSQSFQRPITELLRDRAPVSARSIAVGLAVGWLAGLMIAFAASWARQWWTDALSSILAGTVLSIPTAVLALLLLIARQTAAVAIALTIFPHVFRYCRNILQRNWSLPHIITARAKGIGPARLFCWHVVPNAVPQVIALAGVSVSMAIGAAIPIEVIADSPGVGQLAWQAAMARDLPLLVTLTLLVTLVTLVANTGADLFTQTIEN
jgi:peptide/nickel transport system permease protein